MRQRHDVGRIIAPSAHRFPQSRLHRSAQMIALRVRSYQQRQLHVTQQRQQARPPQRRTLAPGRKVSAFNSPRIAEPHRRNRDHALVVERLAIHPQPIAQPIARCIIPGNAAFVDTSPRRLSRYQNARRRMHPYNRTRLVRQRACAARLDFRNQSSELCRHRAYVRAPIPKS